MSALDRAGVRRLWLAPGARSAALAWAADAWREGTRHRDDPFVVHTHFDERGLGFAAMGSAQADGTPVACLTTSGSAVANLLPAVVESFHAGVPLVLVTADRPREVRGRGASQTIAQPGIFGTFVLQSMDLPCPTAGVSEPELARWMDAALAPLHRLWPGPVHLNVPFREPLLPPDEVPAWRAWRPCSGLPRSPESPISPNDAPLPTLSPPPRGFLVVGELSVREQAGWPEIERLAETLDWPVVVDPLSGGPSISEQRIAHFDYLLQHPSEQWPACRPDVIWHLGGPLVSRRLQEFLATYRNEALVQVRRGPALLDPFYQNPRVFLECPISWARRVADQLSAQTSLTRDRAWSAGWREAGRKAEKHLHRLLEETDEWNEPRWARLVGQWASEQGADLFLGNSMPVRDFGTYARLGAGRVFGQRGASGIDGNLAHLAGWAQASDRPVFALLGDLAVLHDLNSLTLFRGLPIKLFVPNNGGGGIFRFLPLALDEAVREEFLETPHEFSFGALAGALGLAYYHVENRTPAAEIEEWLRQHPGPALLELPSSRAGNHRAHLRLQP